MYNLIFKVFITLSCFRELRGKLQNFPVHPLPPSTAFPITNISHQSGTFVTIDEPTLTHDNHSKFIVYNTVHFRCYTFYGSD